MAAMVKSPWTDHPFLNGSQEDFQQACDDAQLGFVDSLPAPWQRWQRWDFGDMGI